MASIHYNGTQICDILSNPPSKIYFDSHSNPALYSEVYADPTAYSVVDGVLTRDGATVAINPPCEDCAALDALAGATTLEELRKVLLILVEKPGFQRG